MKRTCLKTAGTNMSFGPPYVSLYLSAWLEFYVTEEKNQFQQSLFCKRFEHRLRLKHRRMLFLGLL